MSRTRQDERPVWLLDVDGVVNAVTARPDETVWPTWRTGWATAVGGIWPITWAPAVVEAIVRVHAAGVADIWWLSTWREAAVTSLSPLVGLPEMPVAGQPGRISHGFVGSPAPTGTRWWKLAVARRLLDPYPHRPLVWTDDDLVHQADAREWAEQRPSPTMLIAPATDTGLTAEYLEAIEDFCVLLGA
jgi:hypothetical protein